MGADRFRSLNEVQWSDDIYMKPVEVDSWLMFGKFLGYSKLNELHLNRSGD